MAASDAYLQSLGRTVFAFNGLEWAILGSLPHIARTTPLPEPLQLDNLACQTAGGIEKALAEVNLAALPLDFANWFRLGRKELAALRERRNDLVHAKPASHNGADELYRWLPSKAFWIDEPFLEKLRTDTEAATNRIIAARPHGST